MSSSLSVPGRAGRAVVAVPGRRFATNTLSLTNLAPLPTPSVARFTWGAVALRSAPLSIRDTLSGYADDPIGVREFCARNAVLLHAEAALMTARACFADIETIKLCVRQDPEEDAEWLLVKLAVRGSRDQALASYRAYVQRWTGSVPLPQRGLVRLSYTLA